MDKFVVAAVGAAAAAALIVRARRRARCVQLPGFIDLQLNGYLGVDFSSEQLTREQCNETLHALLAKGGALAIVPTVITSSLAAYEHTLPMLADAIEDPQFEGRLLGIHMEGPFLSPEPGAIGAHPVEHTVNPCDGGIALLDRWQALARGHLIVMTIAAERPGAAELTAHAVSKGLTISLGHHLARAEHIKACADAGATLLTHLGNGCPGQIDRHANHIWPSLADDRLTAMLITDGQHLPPEAIRTMVLAKGVRRTIITSDVSPLGDVTTSVTTSVTARSSPRTSPR